MNISEKTRLNFNSQNRSSAEQRFFTYNKSDTKVDSLVFLFNREGVVESFGYSNENQPTPYPLIFIRKTENAIAILLLKFLFQRDFVIQLMGSDIILYFLRDEIMDRAFFLKELANKARANTDRRDFYKVLKEGSVDKRTGAFGYFGVNLLGYRVLGLQ
jgi:hypothetical protein